jgi:hypothetical protein
MEDLKQDYLNLKHKILFFFMPKTIVFTKREFKDTDNIAILKAVSPCFYWCSGHEFLTDNAENKYLIQHQIYFINGDNIEPAQINQYWSKSKNDIRNGIFSFIEMWRDEHEKVLMSPNMPNQHAKLNEEIPANSFNHIYNFSNFAEFVAKSIFSLKDSYIFQSKEMNFDYVQKEFWKHIALDLDACKEIQTYLNIPTTNEHLDNKKTKRNKISKKPKKQQRSKNAKPKKNKNT